MERTEINKLTELNIDIDTVESLPSLYGLQDFEEEAITNVVKALREYVNLEKERLLQLLPCKIGDYVWGVVSYCNDCPEYDDYCHRGCENPTYRLKKFEVDSFKISEYGLWVRAFSHYDGDGIWGKTVFATEEEAKVALEKMNKEKNDLF
jgi:hypothetical protein